MFDLVIRNGLVVDGSGAEPRHADVGVRDGLIAAVGEGLAPGAEEIDAEGCIVTPGFVDLHTHYDAQVMWDPILAPSAWHGVTTVIMGNCSVGFAPLRRDDRGFAVRVMEAVEEIPADVMEAGIDWDWETYPEYLDALDRRRHTIDIGTQVTHVALRAYVMGDRAESGEKATSEDMSEMARLAEEALRAGALGVAGSRTTAHCYPDGRIVPGTFGDEDELMALAGALGKVDGRVMQYLGNAFDLDRDLPYTMEIARRARQPIHFIMSDTGWQRRLALIEEARAEGLTLYGQVAPRAVGMIGHWRAVQHPFSEAPSVQAIAGRPWEEQLASFEDAGFKARVIGEMHASGAKFFEAHPPETMFEMDAYPDYELDPATDSIAARAARAGQDPLDHAYDVLTRNAGTGMIYVPIANYKPGDFSLIRGFLQNPDVLLSLSDGGAHCTRICDAGAPTFMLTHWARDRKRGETLPLAHVVHSLSRQAALSYGLTDRGLIAEGYLADLNVIDFDGLRLPAPYRAFDFPLGGQRMLQKAEGYVATVKRGEITFRNGEHCGRYPGRVLRGPQAMRAEALEAAE